MIQCVFTIDYEIYGNGQGSLKELVFEPAEKLKLLFKKYNSKFVVFVEAAELEMIELNKTDSYVDKVKDQLREFYQDGIELGLHIHPQWYKGQHVDGSWMLDFSEYNMCTMPEERIEHIIKRSIKYLQNVIGDPKYTPLSFRAGNWLFQPSQVLSKVLAEQGIKVDSSVFKGGLQRKHKLDYRKTLGNGDYWTFSDRVDVPDHKGDLLEIPIYTQMVPFWKMATAKRVGIQRQANQMTAKTSNNWLTRFPDYLRFWHPQKLDFCRMTISELKKMLDNAISKDRDAITSFKPLVAIGHTKDLTDFETIDLFISHLTNNNCAISTFNDVYELCS